MTSPPPTPQSSRLSGLAVVSFCFGWAGVLGIALGLVLDDTVGLISYVVGRAFVFLAVVFGHLARGAIRMRGHQGRQLAHAGLLFGYLGLAYVGLNIVAHDPLALAIYIFVLGAICALVVRACLVRRLRAGYSVPNVDEETPT